MQSPFGMFLDAGLAFHGIADAIDGVGQTQGSWFHDIADNPATQFLDRRLIVADGIRSGTVDGDQEPRDARQPGGDGGEKTVALQTMNMHNIRFQLDNLAAQVKDGLKVESRDGIGQDMKVISLLKRAGGN